LALRAFGLSKGRPPESWKDFDTVFYKLYAGPPSAAQSFTEQILNWFTLHLAAREMAMLNERVAAEMVSARVIREHTRTALGQVIQRSSLRRWQHLEFFAGNTWLVARTQELRATGLSSAKIFTELVRQFPEELAPLDQTIYAAEEIRMHTIVQWIYESEKDPAHSLNHLRIRLKSHISAKAM